MLHNMRSMFQRCSSLTILNLSSFNTRKVIDMDYMFNNCSKLKSYGSTDPKIEDAFRNKKIGEFIL